MRDENITLTSSHSAGKTTVAGMRYQTLYGLYAFFKLRGKHTNLSVRFEAADDIVFLLDNKPAILAQVKHHGYAAKPKKLTNGSNDVWKTIGIWIEHLKYPESENLQFQLITTEQVSDQSIFYALTNEQKKIKFDLETVVAKIDNFCKNKIENADSDMNKYYSAYFGLSPEIKRRFVNRITIFEASPTLDNIDNEIKSYICTMCTPDSVDKLYQEFKAWWGERVEDQISKGEDDAITDTEFASAEERFRKKYSHSILSTKNPELSQNMRESLMGEVFSEQLRFIELSDDEIIDAVDDYYFAKSNRSDWLEKSMVYPDELNSYQDGLKNYWRKEFNRNKRDLTDESTDTELLQSGRKTYETCSKLERHISETKKIDTDVNRITSGSFHILANNEDNAEIPTIGWHPKYEEKLKDKKKEGV